MRLAQQDSIARRRSGAAMDTFARETVRKGLACRTARYARNPPTGVDLAREQSAPLGLVVGTGLGITLWAILAVSFSHFVL